MIVLKLGTEYEVPRSQQQWATRCSSHPPVILDGNLFLRSEDELFCISSD